MMAAPVTDRAHRYRANKLAPVKGKHCLLCGSTKFLVPDHWDGHPDHTNAANLEVLCKGCNTAKGAAFKAAGRGRLTKQYNPTKSGGASNVGEWMQAVGAITPHVPPYPGAVDRGERGLVSDMSTRAAVDMIRATPQHKRRDFAAKLGRRNPAAASAQAFEEFHGYEPRELVTVTEKVHRHKHLAAAGDLVGLAVKPISGGPVRNIEGLGEALLAFNEAKNQLFVKGGDQFLSPSELKKFGVRDEHELQTLGKLVAVGYFTDKHHLGEEGGEAVYSHKFRTTNERGRHITVTIARYPDLIYRVLDQQFEISGGSYVIRAEGIDK